MTKNRTISVNYFCEGKSLSFTFFVKHLNFRLNLQKNITKIKPKKIRKTLSFQLFFYLDSFNFAWWKRKQKIKENSLEIAKISGFSSVVRPFFQNTRIRQFFWIYANLKNRPATHENPEIWRYFIHTQGDKNFNFTKKSISPCIKNNVTK